MATSISRNQKGNSNKRMNPVLFLIIINKTQNIKNYLNFVITIRLSIHM